MSSFARQKNVAVSRLAAYAADPVGYCKNRGQFGSEADCRRGIDAHARAGRPQGNFFSLVIVVVAVAAAVWFFLRWFGWI